MSQASEQIARQYANANINKKTWGDLIFNVKGYTAVGDGVADDTAAIQSAIDAAEAVKGEVWFPPGTYRTTNKLTINADIQLHFVNGASIVADFSSNTIDIIEIGPSGETRENVEIRNANLRFKNNNCRHGINVIANTSKLKIYNLDFRSYNDIYGFCTGAGINFNGNGLPTGLNDWAEFKWCYIAYCVNGIVVDAANVINCKIEQCTFTLTQDRGIKWMRGGQSQISLNTFQNCGVTNPSGALYIDGNSLAASLSNDIWVGPGNSFQNNGIAGAGSSDIQTANCKSIRIIGNQFQSVNATGAYRAILVYQSINCSISYNSFQAYDKGTVKGAVEVPSGSTASYYDNFLESGFEIADGTGIFNLFIGTASFKAASGTEIFRLDTATQVATLKSAVIDGSSLSILQYGRVQLTGGTCTISNTKALNTCKFFLTSQTAKGVLKVSAIVDGVSFTVRSEDTAGAIIAADNGYFDYLFIG